MMDRREREALDRYLTTEPSWRTEDEEEQEEVTGEIPLRTILQWLTEHNADEDAEVWVLTDTDVQPVVKVEELHANLGVISVPVWTEPTPEPLRFGDFFARLSDTYSGGGSLKWLNHTETFRGSYTVNPQTAIFLLFLPREIELVQTHKEKQEQREQQARRISQEIERNQKPWDS